MKKKIIIAGNWKMNLDQNEAKVLAESIAAYAKQAKTDSNISIILIPPYLFVETVSKSVSSSKISVGVQDMHFQDNGAFTGKISGSMIKSMGTQFVLLGHSELRQLFNETDEIVNKKVLKALELNLIPIICVGETLDQRKEGKLKEVLKRQITIALKNVGNNKENNKTSLKDIIIAYEPVWAIGTGVTASAEQADEAHGEIRKIIASLFDQTAASEMLILYGGSMKSSNAKELISCKNINGGLIGGASLNAEDFCKIISIANEYNR